MIVLMSRMEEYLSHVEDPWGVGFQMSLLHSTGFWMEERYDPGGYWTAEEHAARVLYLANHEEKLKHPVDVECCIIMGIMCPQPNIIDGWHRYFAHRLLRRKKINIAFGGLTLLLDYLRGRTKYQPQKTVVF